MGKGKDKPLADDNDQRQPLRGSRTASILEHTFSPNFRPKNDTSAQTSPMSSDAELQRLDGSASHDENGHVVYAADHDLEHARKRHSLSLSDKPGADEEEDEYYNEEMPFGDVERMSNKVFVRRVMINALLVGIWYAFSVVLSVVSHSEPKRSVERS